METILLILVPVILSLLGWWATNTWGRTKDNEKAIAELRLNLAANYRTREESDLLLNEIKDSLNKLGNLELIMAQHYITKAEIKDIFGEFVNKLTKIEDKLDGKVDK